MGIACDISSELTAEATINPDFSQVESDAAQIDVNTSFALFYPERRPFFQKGSDLFDTYFDAVYTRSKRVVRSSRTENVSPTSCEPGVISATDLISASSPRTGVSIVEDPAPSAASMVRYVSRGAIHCGSGSWLRIHGRSTISL
jgi:hypothetical protein